jgi:hypothetical protein
VKAAGERRAGGVPDACTGSRVAQRMPTPISVVPNAITSLAEPRVTSGCGGPANAIDVTVDKLYASPPCSGEWELELYGRWLERERLEPGELTRGRVEGFLASRREGGSFVVSARSVALPLGYASDEEQVGNHDADRPRHPPGAD